MRTKVCESTRIILVPDPRNIQCLIICALVPTCHVFRQLPNVAFPDRLE